MRHNWPKSSLLSDKLNQYGVTLQTAKQEQLSVKALHDELYNIKTITTLFPTLFLLVAILILNVMINRLVTQQRTAIGTLKALGYGNGLLIWHYLSYGIIIGILGAGAGIALGVYLQSEMLNLYKAYFIIPEIKLHFYFENALIGIAISLFSTLLGSFAGARKAIKIEPAEAMRPPPPEKTTHIFLEKWATYWSSLSFVSKMVFREVFRNRVRSLATMTASAMAALLVFSTLSFIDSMNKMISFSFDDIQHQDFILSLRDPVGMETMQTIRTLPGVIAIESQLNIPAELKNGPYLKRLSIMGLPANNKLYTPIDKEEKPVKMEKDGIVLTKTLANILDLHIGDVVQIKPLIGDRQIVRAKVNNIVKTYLGLSIYMKERDLSRLLGDSWVTNTILVKMGKKSDIPTLIKKTSYFAPMINLVDRSESKQSLLVTMKRMMGFFITMMIGFAGIIAIGSMINTALISLNERERDVASLRVLGFSKVQVAKIFFGESLLLNTIGIIIGTIAGIGYCYYISAAFSTEMYRMPVVIRGERLFQSILLMFFFVLISQGIIYRFIVKMNWFSLLNTRE